MIEIKTLKKILNFKDEELKKLSVEQLRAMLGTFRYLVRGLEREINRRNEDRPFGNISDKKSKDNRGKN